MIENFYGNPEAASTLVEMLAESRVPQTILLHGPSGIGKATLVRRFAALALHLDPNEVAKLEQDDLFLPHNQEMLSEREKLPSEKRAEDPLMLSSYPDFVTFAPDGPLRQVSIQQIRALKDQAMLGPVKGKRRIFLIDHLDRANEQAANSLLKVLEEPPDHLIIFATAENVYDLLPTIRSRSVSLALHRLPDEEVIAYCEARKLDKPQRRARLANGTPGAAAAIDLDLFDKRRTAMLSLLEVASRTAPFGTWLKFADSIGASKNEKLEYYLEVLYVLLEDLLLIAHGSSAVKNTDIAPKLQTIANTVSFRWLQRAVTLTDEMSRLLRRNIQKSIALDAFAIELRDMVVTPSSR